MMLFLRILISAFILSIFFVSCSSTGEESESLYSEGLKFFSTKDLARAEELFMAAHKKDGGHLNALLMLSKISYYNRDYDRSIARADALLKKSPMHSGALYWKARCVIMSDPERGGEVMELLKSSLESDSGNLQARQLLGLVCEREGMYREALHHYFEALKEEETLVNVRVNLALLYDRMGLKERGAAEIEKALQIARAAGIPEKNIASIKGDMRK